MPESNPDLSAPGESAGFELLMRTYYVQLCEFAFHLVHSRDVAEDIVQDVFAQLWKTRKDLEMRDPVRYLYQAVRNRVINHRRRQGVREGWQRYVLARTDEAGEDREVESIVEAADLASAYHRALRELPERCRLVFAMSREQGLTYPEIADALTISVKTVETQMGKALKLLRHRLHPFLSIVVAAFSGRWLA